MSFSIYVVLGIKIRTQARKYIFKMTEFLDDKKIFQNSKVDSQINLSSDFVVYIVHEADEQLTYMALIWFILNCKN